MLTKKNGCDLMFELLKEEKKCIQSQYDEF